MIDSLKWNCKIRRAGGVWRWPEEGARDRKASPRLGQWLRVRPSSPPGGQALPATHQSLYLVRTTTGEAM